MFIIEEFIVCPLTNKVDVRLLMDAGSGEVEDMNSFLNEKDAIAWINYMKVQYFILRFERWINELKLLHQSGNPFFYQTQVRQNAFRIINDFHWKIVGQPAISQLADSILELEYLFGQVLPAQSSPNYSTSLKKLEGFLSFAKSHTTRALVMAN